MNRIDRDELSSILDRTKISNRLKQSLRFVPEEIASWEDLDFIAVANKSGSEGVILAPLTTFFVVPFSIQKRKPDSKGRIEAVICDFCKTWQRGSNSARISFTKERSRVSFLCCADLLCSLHVRDITKESTLSRTQLRENISKEQRINRLRIALEDTFASLKD